MLELKRIYWTRQTLKLAFTAVTVWLFASAILSFTAKANVGAGAAPSSGIQVVRGLFDGVIAAATLPGLVLVVLIVVAAVINAAGAAPNWPACRG